MIRNTGFAAGLYDEREANSKAIGDKDSKVAWLTKIIETVGLAGGQPLACKPLKIVAGLEPEQTNAFLQALGRCAQAGDGAAAVQQVLAKAAAPAPEPKSKEAAEAPAEGERPKAGGRAKEEKPGRGKEEKRKEQEKKEKKAPAKAGAKKEDEPIAKPKLQRPMSARKAPPKLKTGVVEPKPASKPPAAGARGGLKQVPSPKAASGIVMDGASDDEDDDDIQIVEEAPRSRLGGVSRDKGGRLVRDILDEKQRLDDTGANAQSPMSKAASPKEKGVILGRRRASATLPLEVAEQAAVSINSQADLDTIKEDVQKLCQSTNPLGKAIDHLQEDVESMGKEYSYWFRERKMYEQKLHKQSLPKMDPALVEKLGDMDGQIATMKEKIAAMMADIAYNDTKIERLVRLVVDGTH